MKPEKIVNVKVQGVAADDENDTEEKSEFDKYELEDAVRTLQKAEEIKQNAKLMKAIGPHLDRHIKTIKSMSQLRKVASKKIMEGMGE